MIFWILKFQSRSYGFANILWFVIFLNNKALTSMGYLIGTTGTVSGQDWADKKKNFIGKRDKSHWKDPLSLTPKTLHH